MVTGTRTRLGGVVSFAAEGGDLVWATVGLHASAPFLAGSKRDVLASNSGRRTRPWQ